MPAVAQRALRPPSAPPCGVDFAITLAVGLMAWLLLTAPTTIPVATLITSVAAFTVASLIEFEIGPGSAVPTTPVMIVSLFLLPPALVPVAAVLGLFGSSLIQRLHDESPGTSGPLSC